MIIHNFEQGSDEWYNIRLGKITASKIKDVLAKGQGKTRDMYMRELCSEILTGLKDDGYTNAAMDFGKETEENALNAYSLVTDLEVESVGFVEHESGRMGCSPDGLVGEDGLIEIKCPKTTTHIQTVIDDKVPTPYIKQMQFQLFITGKKWVDFVSFDPRLHVNKRIFIKRVERDEQMISLMKEECDRFIYELDELVKKMKG